MKECIKKHFKPGGLAVLWSIPSMIVLVAITDIMKTKGYELSTAVLYMLINRPLLVMVWFLNSIVFLVLMLIYSVRRDEDGKIQ